MAPPPTIQTSLPTAARCRRQADPDIHWPDAIAALAHKRVLKRSAAGLVIAGTAPHGPAVVVKVRRLPGAKGTIRALLGVTPLARAWRTACRLRTLGVATAEPLALLAGRDGQGRVDVLVLPEIAGRTLLDRLADRDLPGAAERAAAEQLAGMIATLARHRLTNRDHKPSNIIVDDAGRPTLLDAELRTASPAAAAARMLASLAIEPAGVGVAIPPALAARVLARVARRVSEAGTSCSARELRDAAHAIVQHHGDPTPKDNPLTAPEPA